MIFVVLLGFYARNAIWRCAVDLVDCMAWELAVFDGVGKQAARV
jgi:hypothetical protein